MDKENVKGGELVSRKITVSTYAEVRRCRQQEETELVILALCMSISGSEVLQEVRGRERLEWLTHQPGHRLLTLIVYIESLHSK